MKNRVTLLVVLAFVTVFCWGPSRCFADEVADQIKEGLGLYEKGNFSEAVTSLNFAVGQIQQAQASGLKKVFPQPLAGWEAEETSGNFAPAAFGGGVSASKSYRKDDESVDIEIVTDSPLLQSVMTFYSNPAFYAGQADTKLIKVQNRKAIQRFTPQDEQGEIQIVIANRMLVTIKASGTEKPDNMLAYANAIDYNGIEAFLQNK
jgi:hypothetical protein